MLQREQYCLNNYTPFSVDRANIARASLGFTDITGANVLGCWERTFRDLGSLDPISSSRTSPAPPW